MGVKRVKNLILTLLTPTSFLESQVIQEQFVLWFRQKAPGMCQCKCVGNSNPEQWRISLTSQQWQTPELHTQHAQCFVILVLQSIGINYQCWIRHFSGDILSVSVSYIIIWNILSLMTDCHQLWLKNYLSITLPVIQVHAKSIVMSKMIIEPFFL